MTSAKKAKDYQSPRQEKQQPDLHSFRILADSWVTAPAHHEDTSLGSSKDQEDLAVAVP